MSQQAGGTRQEAGHRTGIGALWCVVATLALALTAGCSSTPSYPDPSPNSGQILVQLRGEAREGVSGPKHESVRLTYGSSRQSIEQGLAFERVDYDAIDDVVVILHSETPLIRDIPVASQWSETLTITADGFDRPQVATGPNPAHRKITTSLRFKNERDTPLVLYGLSDDGPGFEIEVPARGEATAVLFDQGVYEVLSDDDEGLHCRWYAVTRGDVWVGTSRHGAFFDALRPGKYEVTVHPPRLPSWSRTVTVKAGQRETVTADLTVNQLPKAGK